MDDHKIYILTFDALNVNLRALEQYMRDSTDIIGHWNYIPLVYCVKSHLSSRDLALKIHSFIVNGNFALMEINKVNIDGRLPFDAWNWFYQDAKPTPHADAFASRPPSYGEAASPH